MNILTTHKLPSNNYCWVLEQSEEDSIDVDCLISDQNYYVKTAALHAGLKYCRDNGITNVVIKN